MARHVKREMPVTLHKPLKLLNLPKEKGESAKNLIGARGFIRNLPLSGHFETTTHTRVFGRDLDRSFVSSETKPYLDDAFFECMAETGTFSFADDHVSLHSTHSESNVSMTSLFDEINLETSQYGLEEKNKTYMGLLIYNESKKILVNSKGMIPCLQVSDSNCGLDEFLWARQTAQDWEPTSNQHSEFSFNRSLLQERFHLADSHFKRSFFRCAMAMNHIFQLQNMGIMHHKPIFFPSLNTSLILNIVRVLTKELDKETLKRCKFQCIKEFKEEFWGINENFSAWNKPQIAYRRQLSILRSGLYLALFDFQVTLNGIFVSCQSHYPSLPPLVKIRTETSLEPRELDTLRNYCERKIPKEEEFHKEMKRALDQLSLVTGLSDLSMAHIASSTPVQLNNGVSLIIVARMTSLGSALSPPNPRFFERIHLNLFETLHFGTYDSGRHRENSVRIRALRQGLVRSEKQKVAVSGLVKEIRATYFEKRWTRVLIKQKSNEAMRSSQ